MKLRSKLFYSYILFVITLSLLTLLPAPDHAALIKYHLHPTGLRLLDATLLVPTFVMWFAVFYGYHKLRRYSQLIKRERDGKQVVKLANGLLILALGLPINSIIGSVLALYARSHPGFTAPAAIFSNYLNVAYPLAAFIFINRGARGLNAFSRSRPSSLLSHIVVLADIILGVIFCDLIAHAHHSLQISYHMSYSLVMLTFAIPYMYTWFLGMYAVVEMYAYSQQLSGVLYRKGWDRLALGLGAIVILDILLQYLGTLASWLNSLTLASMLGLLYVLLFLLAGAFIVVALGTKELMKIEEA